MVDVQDTSAVKDKFRLNFILFYCFGTLVQLSSSVLSNAQSYWIYKFRDTEVPWNPSSNTTTSLQNEFTADFTLASGLPTILVFGLSLLYARKCDPVYKLLGGFCVYILMFLCIILCVLINTDSWQTEFFYLTLGIIVIIASNDGFCLLAILQLLTKLPPVFLTAYFAGEAVVGILASSLEILTLLVDGTPTTCGVIYFSIALALYILTLTGFLLLLQYSTFLHYHIRKAENTENAQNYFKLKIDWSLLKKILKKQKCLIVSFCLLSIITPTIQPAITATAKSVNSGNGSRWNDTFFQPVVTFLLFHVLDVLSRETALRTKKPKNKVLICTLSFSRIFLVPLILMCHLTAKHHIPDVFYSDWAYIISIILFAVSNGYMINITLIAFNENSEKQKNEQGHMIALLAIISIVGDIISSLLSIVLVKII